MTDFIKVGFDGGILCITLNRPEKMNAITDAMYGQMADALERADTDPAVGAVLLTGGGDSFTAGNDIDDFMAVAAGDISIEQRQVVRFLKQLAVLQSPLVAAVPGLAVGVGTTMLLHCDLVYLAENATLATPFVDLGLVPEAASSLLLPRRVGHVAAFAIFALGETLSAAHALRLGLANRVLPSAELQAAARSAAATLCAKPRAALRHTKALMRDSAEMLSRMSTETTIFQAQLKGSEAQAAFATFKSRARRG